jgi:glyoxylase-like metal-dependent hydrolase (beta-lactamase superfamily II)
MKHSIWLSLLTTALLLTGCAKPTPEQQIINDAAAALGGKDKVLAAKTLVLEGQGSNGNLGQDMTPEATTQTFTVSAFKRVIDLGAPKMRTEQTRTPNFTYFQGPAPQKQIVGIDGEVGYNIGADGTATRTNASVARDRRIERYHHPLTLVRAALADNAKLANPRTANNQKIVDITVPDGGTVTLALDAATNRPTRIVSMADNPNLGDVAIETTFSDYKTVNGLNLPAKSTTTTDRVMTTDLTFAKQTLDADAGDLTVPAAAASATVPAAVPAVNVTSEEVAPGVWFLAGQSHHSVAIEFADHIMLVEAPLSEARSLAVIEKAKTLKAGKPVTQVVNTHHHFDHSAGIRAAVSEGLEVITHQGNAAFYQNAIGRAHTINPDALAKSPKPLKAQTIAEELTLKDAMRTVEIYHVPMNAHSDTMLMVYLPKDKLLIEADLYTPGAAVNAFAPSLISAVNDRKLKVEKIVPIHGPIAAWTDLQPKTGNKVTRIFKR